MFSRKRAYVQSPPVENQNVDAARAMKILKFQTDRRRMGWYAVRSFFRRRRRRRAKEKATADPTHPPVHESPSLRRGVT